MNLWLEAIAATTFAAFGVLLGYFFSRLPKPYWTFGYFIPLILVLIYGIANHVPSLCFTPPISWMMMGREKFAIMGFIAGLILTTPISRLPKRHDRIIVSLLMAVMIFSVSVWPFIRPVFDRKELSRLQTQINADGVCIQTTDYTCGPAAAVTALRKLGLPAEEGRIAILSETSSIDGTAPDMLAETLQNIYGKATLLTEYRPFKDISELKQAGLTLAVIKYSLLEDHWVAVLQVTDSEVLVGDPVGGLVKMSYNDFQEKWRFIGIVLKRRA
jgi:predicted double-glycine peptidase